MSTITDIQGVDFHCHIDLFPNPPDMVSSCEDNQILTLAVTTTPKAWPQNRKWTDPSYYVYSALGLHPELVGQRYDEINLLEDWMDQTRLVGEIGLDGSPNHRKSWEKQTEVFSRALKRANDLGGRVLSIHSRRAANEVLDMIKCLTSINRVIPILHWYSGTKTTVRKAVEHGCYFSVNLQMLAHESGRGLIESLPTDRLLTETDAPFTSLDGCKCDPTHSIGAAEQVAHLKGIPKGDFNELLQANARRVLAFTDISI